MLCSEISFPGPAKVCGDVRASSYCPAKGRSLRLSRRVATVAAIVAGSLLAPSAADAAPTARLASDSSAVGLLPADSHVTLARLEARAAKLSRQYRGQLLKLSEAAAAAKRAAAQAQRLRSQLSGTRRQIARLAAASYMGGGLDPALAARVKVAELRRLIATLVSQRRRVERLMARFRPQSPEIGGDHITARMREVRDQIDRRFGPFPVIACYRPGGSGEHPLGRACDFMLSSGGVMPAGPSVQRGYNVAAWARANASRLGIMYIIYRQRIWDIRMASSGWVLLEDRGSITANHFDHVHISVF